MDFKPQFSSVGVLEASVPAFEVDPFGKIDLEKRGYLKLKGPVMHKAEGSSHYRFFNPGGERFIYFHSAPDPMIRTHDAESPLPLLNENGDPIIGLSKYEKFSNDKEDEEIIGRIYPDSWEDVDLDRENGPVSVIRITENYGLLLTSNSEPGFDEIVFKRIGLYEIPERKKVYFHENSSIEVITII